MASGGQFAVSPETAKPAIMATQPMMRHIPALCWRHRRADTADKGRVYGELYAITMETRQGSEPRIVELIKGFDSGNQPCTVGVWYAFSLAWDTSLGFGRRGRVDGPLGFEHWQGKCRGRVVSVMVA